MQEKRYVKPADLYVNKIGEDQWTCFNPGSGGGVVVIPASVKAILEKCHAENVEESSVLDALASRGVVIDMANNATVQVSQISRKSASYWFHVTNRCNLRCTYCYINKDAEGMSIETARMTTARIIRDCKEKGITLVNFKFAGGEPMLAIPVIREVIRVAQSDAGESCRANYGIITNATAMTPSNALFLKENGILVSVSLDGPQSSNDKARLYTDGSGSYADIIRGIDHLRNVGIQPLILTVVSPGNMEALPEFMKWLISEGLCSRFSFCRDKEVLERYGMRRYQEDLSRYLRETYVVLGENIPSIPMDRFHNTGNLNFSGRRTRYCGRGINGYAVSHTGKFALCQETIGSPVVIGSGNHISGFEDMDLASEDISECHGCRSCQWRYVCGGDCPELKRKFFGSSSRPSPYCSVLQAVIPQLIDLRGKQLVKTNKAIKERR